MDEHGSKRMILCSLIRFSHPLFTNVLKTRIKSIFFKMRLSVSVDTSFWDTPISNREVVIEKQYDFIRKEIRKKKTIQYVHCNEKCISILVERMQINHFCLNILGFFP